jgi:hypothetical protein
MSVRFLLIALLLVQFPGAVFARVALVIGNGNYQHSSQLKNPRNDASDVAAALRDIGFDVVEGFDLDRRGMEQKIRSFSDKLETSKLALFFYAGHGLQVDGRNYLVPIDAKLTRPGDLALDAIDIKVVLDQMEEVQRVNLVFLDACRDNPLSRSFASRLGTRSSSVGAGLAPINSTIGTLIAFATQPSNVALDGTGRNSPFSEALLRHIKTSGADISEVMRRVRRDVIETTNRRQVPWDHSSLTDTVVLVPKGPPVGGPLIAPAPSRPPLTTASIPAQQPPRPGRSYWDHNGSVMHLHAKGAERRFYYDQPRELMQRAGAKSGTLLFEGRKDANSYVGTARIFAGECGSFTYSVSGPISEDQRTVVMTGQAPRIDLSTCRVIGYRDDRLVFEFQEVR